MRKISLVMHSIITEVMLNFVNYKFCSLQSMNMIYIMLLTLPLQAIKNKTDVQLILLSKILSASCGLIEI